MPDSPGLPCYDAAYDRESGDYHLLLKDVSETHVTVEREAPATKPDVERMLDTLAQFHAHWWGHPRLGETGLVDAAFVKGEGNLDFAGFVDYLGDRLSDERRNIYEQVLTSLPRLLEGRVVAERGLTSPVLTHPRGQYVAASQFTARQGSGNGSAWQSQEMVDSDAPHPTGDAVCFATAG